MRHRQIEAFRSVMVAGSVTEASKSLHVSQPSVSRLISDLEHATGLTLFERKHGRIYPTVEAVQLFEEVERSFQGLDRLARFARTLSDLRQAHLTISGMPALSVDLIPNIVAKLMSRYPEAKVTIEARSSERIVDWIALQRCDIGFAAPPFDVSGVVCHLAVSAPCVLAMPKSHRLASRDVVDVAALCGEKIILLTNPFIKQKLREAMADAGLPDVDYIDTTLSFVACRLVEKGLGIAVIEPFTTSLFSGRGLVFRPLAPSITFEFGLLSPERRAASKSVREIRDITLECMEEMRRDMGIDLSFGVPDNG